MTYFIKGIVKGDSVNFPILVNTGVASISAWKIRAELYDDDGCFIKLGNSNVTGGSDSQIEITDATKGEFTIKVLKDATKNFHTPGRLEIEMENPDGQVFTALAGKETEIEFLDQKIEWTDVT